MTHWIRQRQAIGGAAIPRLDHQSFGSAAEWIGFILITCALITNLQRHVFSNTSPSHD